MSRECCFGRHLSSSAAIAPAHALVSVGVDHAPANGESLEPDMSPSGRCVAFRSGADNLMPGGRVEFSQSDLVRGNTPTPWRPFSA